MHEPSPLTKGPCCVLAASKGRGAVISFDLPDMKTVVVLQSMEPVVYLGWNEIFLLGCLHLNAICQLYCGRPGSVLTWFYSKFVMGPIQELKVNMVIYLHAHKQADFVRHSWWLLVWRFPCLAACAGVWCADSPYKTITQRDDGNTFFSMFRWADHTLTCSISSCDI